MAEEPVRLADTVVVSRARLEVVANLLESYLAAANQRRYWPSTSHTAIVARERLAELRALIDGRISPNEGGGSVSTPDDVRLYGLPHAERMYLDVASLYESEVDPYYDEHTPDSDLVVEEWTVADPLSLMPDADWFLTFLEERLCEEHSHDNDDCGWIFKSPTVLAAAENLRQVIASKVTWHQAEKHLADHKLTLAKDGPLFDGDPVYRKRHNDG